MESSDISGMYIRRVLSASSEVAQCCGARYRACGLERNVIASWRGPSFILSLSRTPHVFNPHRYEPTMGLHVL